jgi:hypothetical protein
LQAFIREKIKKRWKYVHSNAMGVAFLLDPRMDIMGFVGDDDEEAVEAVYELARRCGLLTTSTGLPKLTAEIVAFKSLRMRGGHEMQARYSEKVRENTGKQ